MNKYNDFIDQGDYESLIHLLENETYIDSPAAAIKLLCRLQSVVANVEHDWPADCICGDTAPLDRYRNSGNAIRFVIEATLDRIKKSEADHV